MNNTDLDTDESRSNCVTHIFDWGGWFGKSFEWWIIQPPRKKISSNSAHNTSKYHRYLSIQQCVLCPTFSLIPPLLLSLSLSLSPSMNLPTYCPFPIPSHPSILFFLLLLARFFSYAYALTRNKKKRTATLSSVLAS